MRRCTPNERTWVAFVFIVALIVLALAVYLKPDPKGYGTHTQLYLAPCGFQFLTGLPCPTCGMTTCFAHAIRLEFRDAFMVQPFGLLLFFLTALACAVAFVSLVTGICLHDRLKRVNWKIITIAATMMLIGAWVFKIISR